MFAPTDSYEKPLLSGLRAEQSPIRALAIVVLNGRPMITSVAVLDDMVFFWDSMRLGSKVLNIKSILPELSLPTESIVLRGQGQTNACISLWFLASNLL